MDEKAYTFSRRSRNLKNGYCVNSPLSFCSFFSKIQECSVFAGRCDRVVTCTDSSDEIGCVCDENEFTCDCIKEMTCTLSKGYISKNKVTNRYLHCPNRRVLLTSLGRVNIHRLKDVPHCNDLGFPQCNNLTCFSSHLSHCNGDCCSATHALFTSYCDDEEKCNGILQCSDNSLILFSKFCDGIVDCQDGSDEVTNHQGFKCNKCVLPHNNLYDDFVHCNDSSDLCLDDGNACFECFDKRLLISSHQVCNNVSDCNYMSDECLCEKYFETEMCKRCSKQMLFSVLAITHNSLMHLSMPLIPQLLT